MNSGSASGSSARFNQLRTVFAVTPARPAAVTSQLPASMAAMILSARSLVSNAERPIGYSRDARAKGKELRGRREPLSLFRLAMACLPLNLRTDGFMRLLASPDVTHVAFFLNRLTSIRSSLQGF